MTARIDRDVAAVLLDVGGVFFVPDHDVYRAVLEAAALSPPERALDRGHYAGIRAMDLRGQLDWSGYFAALAAAIESQDLAQALEASWDRQGIWTRVLPGSVEGLQEIARTGVELAIVSNSDGTVEASLRDAGICQVGPGPGVPVGVVIDSHVVGVEKPDPAIFALALGELGMPAERAVHVGDTVFSDVRGAEAAGVLGIHFDPFELCPETDDHVHAASLREVAALVSRTHRRL